MLVSYPTTPVELGPNVRFTMMSQSCALIECNFTPTSSEDWEAFVEVAALNVMEQIAKLSDTSDIEAIIISVLAPGKDEVSQAAVAAIRGISGSAALELGTKAIRVETVIYDDERNSEDLVHTLRYLADPFAAGNITGGTIDLRNRSAKRDRIVEENAVALVTGAAGSLGQAAVIAFKEAGYQVVITDLPGEALDRTARELGVTAIGANLGSDEDVTKLLADERLSDLHTVAIYHGVSASTRLDKNYNPRLAGRSMAINVTAVRRVINAVRPILTVNGGGTIIVLSSQAGLVSEEGNAAYSGAKFAAVGLVEGLVEPLALDSIRIHALCPGPINTSLWRSSYEGNARDLGMEPEEFLAKRLSNIPLRQIGQPHHVGSCAPYLSKLSATGVVLAPNGGEVLN